MHTHKHASKVPVKCMTVASTKAPHNLLLSVNLLLFSLPFIYRFTQSTPSSHFFLFLAGGKTSDPCGQCHDGFLWSQLCVLFQKGSAVRASECPAVASLGPCQPQLLHHQETGLTSPDCT